MEIIQEFFANIEISTSAINSNASDLFVSNNILAKPYSTIK